MNDIQFFFQEYKGIIIIIHAIGAAIGVGAATISDFTFFNFLKDGKVSPKESSVFRILTKAIWLALTILILSGIALYLSNPDIYSQSSKFILKMSIVAVLFLNGLIMTLYLHNNMSKLSFLTKKNIVLKRVAFASGAVSIVSWYLAFILGSIRSIPISARLGFLIYATLVTGGVIVSQIIYNRYKNKYKKSQ